MSLAFKHFSYYRRKVHLRDLNLKFHRQELTIVYDPRQPENAFTILKALAGKTNLNHGDIRLDHQSFKYDKQLLEGIDYVRWPFKLWWGFKPLTQLRWQLYFNRTFQQAQLKHWFKLYLDLHYFNQNGRDPARAQFKDQLRSCLLKYLNNAKSIKINTYKEFYEQMHNNHEQELRLIFRYHDEQPLAQILALEADNDIKFLIESNYLTFIQALYDQINDLITQRFVIKTIVTKQNVAYAHQKLIHFKELDQVVYEVCRLLAQEIRTQRKKVTLATKVLAASHKLSQKRLKQLKHNLPVLWPRYDEQLFKWQLNNRRQKITFSEQQSQIILSLLPTEFSAVKVELEQLVETYYHRKPTAPDLIMSKENFKKAKKELRRRRQKWKIAANIQINKLANLLGIETLLLSKRAEINLLVRQKLTILNALLHQPQFILLPVMKWKQLLADYHWLQPIINKLPIGIIVAANRLEPWLPTASKIAVFVDGQLQQLAPPTIIKTAPLNTLVINAMTKFQLNIFPVTIDRYHRIKYKRLILGRVKPLPAQPALFAIEPDGIYLLPTKAQIKPLNHEPIIGTIKEITPQLLTVIIDQDLILNISRRAEDDARNLWSGKQVKLVFDTGFSYCFDPDTTALLATV